MKPLVGIFLWGGIALLWQVRQPSVGYTLPIIFITFFLFFGGLYFFIRTSIKRFSFGLILFLFAGTLFFTIAESLTLFAKHDYRVTLRTIIDEPWKNPININDPVLLHIHKPGLHFKGIQPSGDVGFYMKISEPIARPYDVKIDQEGFRNSNPSLKPDIIVIGDSFVEATLVSEPDTVSAKLSKISAKTVTNYGQIWYGPEQELEVFRRFALPKKPKDIVWIIFGGNDLTDSLRYHENKENWDTKVKSFHSIYQRSFTKNVLSFIYAVFAKKPERPKALEEKCGEFGLFSFYYSEKRLNSDLERAYKNLLASLREAAELSEKNQIRLTVAYAPVKAKAMVGICQDSNKTLSQWAEGDLSERLAIDMKKMGIRYVDLAPELIHATKTKGPTYFSDDTHWNSTGHEAAANAIAKTLK